ncbi:MAG: 2-polyprenyl-3-methyl-5-hydroxy-6-metoxy-1,4-benzoquinol methylase [Planctomycetota bacterium]|jgi:2-polyprenyl-3-methyl-5-hydroxy-6-metoxy-1,4-benzoquinol methylase
MKKFRWKVAQFFERLWWANYLKKKEKSEYLSWKKDYWTDFLKKFSFEFNKNQNILDVGCGPAGTFVLSNIESAHSWTAVDPLVSNYKELEIFNKVDYPKVDFINSSFEEFKSEKNFDVVFCINAINHFINLDGNLLKLNKLLTKDGEMILSTDTHNYKFLKWILYSLPLDILHPHQYTDEEYEQMFTKAKFKIEKKILVKKEFIFSYHAYLLKKK